MLGFLCGTVGQNDLFVCVRRNSGYVYTYRLHKDDSGSWAAEV